MVHLQLVKLPLVANIQTQDWEWTSIAHILSEIPSCEQSFPEEWEQWLQYKRSDEGYILLVESIKRDGLLWPVHLEKNGSFGNGHHRLAACIDLGYTHIPATRKLTDCGYDHPETGDTGLTSETWKNLIKPVDNPSSSAKLKGQQHQTDRGVRQ